MTSTCDRARRAVLACGAALLLHACGLERPPDPPPFDCATIDRAAERFPEECGDPDASTPEPDGSHPDAGTRP